MIIVYPIAAFIILLIIHPHSMNDLKQEQEFRIKGIIILHQQGKQLIYVLELA